MRHVLIGAALLVAGCGVDCPTVEGHALRVVPGAASFDGPVDDLDGCGIVDGVPFEERVTAWRPWVLAEIAESVGMEGGGRPIVEGLRGTLRIGNPPTPEMDVVTHICTADVGEGACVESTTFDCVPLEEATEETRGYDFAQLPIRVELHIVEPYVSNPPLSYPAYDGDVVIVAELCTVELVRSRIDQFDLP